MTAFHVCGFDSDNEPVQFCITLQSDNTAVITGYKNSSVTDDDEFLSCLLLGSHWKLGEIRSWSDQESVGFGHAVIQYILHKIFGDCLWFNYVSIVRVE